MTSYRHHQESVYKDMGEHTEKVMNNRDLDDAQELKSNEKTILKDIQELIRSRQLYARELSFATPWVLKKAVEKEHDHNSIHAYQEVLQNSVPFDAYIISSHTVSKVKVDEERILKLKARLVNHGNKYETKDVIRKDCSNADMVFIRLLVSIAVCVGFNFKVADVAGAFFQSSPIVLEIFLRPAPEFRKEKNFIETHKSVRWNSRSRHAMGKNCISLDARTRRAKTRFRG